MYTQSVAPTYPTTSGTDITFPTYPTTVTSPQATDIPTDEVDVGDARRDWTVDFDETQAPGEGHPLRSIYEWFRANPTAEGGPSMVISSAGGQAQLMDPFGMPMGGDSSGSEYSSLLRSVEEEEREEMQAAAASQRR